MAIERLSDAIEVLDRITRLRILLQTSNLQETTSDGIWLGRAFERMRLRAFEPHTWRGLNTTHQIRRAKKPRKNYSIYQTEFNECLREFPSATTWQICKVLARKFPVSPKTIRRHIKDPRSAV
jgi:hypothetical protein